MGRNTIVSRARRRVRAALANDWLVVAALMALGFFTTIAIGFVIVGWLESIGLADILIRRPTRPASE
jgi:hypothetical protein